MRRRPQIRTPFSSKARRLSYAELDRLSDRFASALAGFGVQRGDRVALVLPNCPQFLIAEFGAWKAGATVLPLNPLYTGAGAGRTAPLGRRQGRGDAHAVLSAPQGKPIADRASSASSPRASRNICRRRCGCSSRCSRNRKAVIGFACKPGDVWFQDCLAGERFFSALRKPGARRAPMTTPSCCSAAARRERRKRCRPPPRSRRGGPAIERLASPAGAEQRRHRAAAAAALSCLRVRRRAEPRLRQPHAPRAGAQSARSGRPAEDHREGQADAVHRGAGPVHRVVEPSESESQEGRFQLDSRLLLRRRAADGRHKITLRRADRRADCRRLLADRSDDGVRREPAERHQQARIGRPSAARRGGRHRRSRNQAIDSWRGAKRARSSCARRS